MVSPSPPTATTATATTTTTDPFPFPPTYNFPPFFTPQPNRSTRSAQLQKWSALIQAWCRHHRTFRLSLIDAVESPLFHNATLRKRVSLGHARDIIDWMAAAGGDEDGMSTTTAGAGGGGGGGGGGKRAEWVDAGHKSVAWIWWRRPEEWAGLVADWVENTGQKNVVLTVYELLEGEATISQEWHGMDPEVMLRSLNVLVKRGKAQVFGSEGQEGVKFF